MSGARLRSRTPDRRAERNLIFREQLSRNEQFFKRDGQANIERAYVCVVGVGGVGSHAAHMLARAGVARLRLIDFDQVTLSSLNRHAVATREDVGRTKVAACARHFERFNPRCEVEAVPRMFTAEAAEELILGPRQAQYQHGNDGRGAAAVDESEQEHDRPDFVVDCIDDAVTKAPSSPFASTTIFV